MRRRPRRLLAAALAVTALGACGGEGEASGPAGAGSETPAASTADPGEAASADGASGDTGGDSENIGGASGDADEPIIVADPPEAFRPALASAELTVCPERSAAGGDVDGVMVLTVTGAPRGATARAAVAIDGEPTTVTGQVEEEGTVVLLLPLDDGSATVELLDVRLDDAPVSLDARDTEALDVPGSPDCTRHPDG